MRNIISWNVNIELSRAMAARREIIANTAALSTRTRHYCRITNIFHDLQPTCGYVCPFVCHSLGAPQQLFYTLLYVNRLS
ncbi:hypothetical protein NP493_4279g00004 [Ridgeia piscesae]|uniref:Uncharacterized protein n=1 Tax=Ridgeia piscesae TaxID=27915 RepID=A0AAD9IR82_RIDPI|nr:hypothetical protein NP493_7170g00004 [Ridgeia piscesae]KAK2138766.1 hypothetical protein NP493_7170g00008 [Ridgeia piscesae]KAK2144162.1 hypothetical protein NP493_4279g00004 [Ridgeia piscesae]